MGQVLMSQNGKFGRVPALLSFSLPPTLNIGILCFCFGLLNQEYASYDKVWTQENTFQELEFHFIGNSGDVKLTLSYMYFGPR